MSATQGKTVSADNAGARSNISVICALTPPKIGDAESLARGLGKDALNAIHPCAYDQDAPRLMTSRRVSPYGISGRRRSRIG
jgi:hypothetical protein